MSETKKTETQNQSSKGAKVVKAILNTIINIMIVLVLIVSILIAVMALTSKASGISTIFGYTIQPIQSDSMKGGSPDGYEGGDFEKGDLMIAKATNFDSNAVYDLGDIITYVTVDSAGGEILMAHRIVDVVKNQDGNFVYQTQGDNRLMAQVPDQEEVSEYLTASDIASVFYTKDYEGKIIKGAGSVLDYLGTQQGFFFVVLLPMIIFFMYAMVRVVLSAAGYKKSKAEEDKNEAVEAAVAAALAAKEANDANSSAAAAPEGMTAEQMEQFKQFMEFQKMQNAAKDVQEKPAETDNTVEE